MVVIVNGPVRKEEKIRYSGESVSIKCNANVKVCPFITINHVHAHTGKVCNCLITTTATATATIITIAVNINVNKKNDKNKYNITSMRNLRTNENKIENYSHSLKSPAAVLNL